MYVGLGRQLKEAKAILAKEDEPIDCSPVCTQELVEENIMCSEAQQQNYH